MKHIPIILVLSSFSCLSFAQQKSSGANNDFDFLLGDWTIYYSGTTMVAGNSSVELTNGGLSINEIYTAISGGIESSSESTYDGDSKKWVQTYTDNTGTTFTIKGKFKNGKMKLEVDSDDEDDARTLHRITWEPNDDGTIRQIWEQKEVGNKSKWNVVFDGLYKPWPTAID